MDTRSQESKLRNEIQYLTREIQPTLSMFMLHTLYPHAHTGLIAAHKAIKSLQTPDEAPAAKVIENNGAKAIYRNK